MGIQPPNFAYGDSLYAYGDLAPKICIWGLPICIQEFSPKNCTWLRKLPTCRQLVATTAKCWHILPKCLHHGDTILIPTQFLCWGLPTSIKFSYSTQATYLNFSVRFGRNNCLISVCHGPSSSSWHKNWKSSQLLELFQHKAASIKQHLLAQHELGNNIELAHPYRFF